MKFGNAIRKIAAFGTGMTMVGATMMGALAADLSNYPKMFMKDDKLNAVVVMGSKAMPIDIVGAVDVAFSLQAAAVTTKDIVTGGKETVSGDGKIEASGNSLNLLEPLNTIGSGKLKKADLPVLLADGTLTDDSSNEDYDFSQELSLSADFVTFAQNDDVDENMPKMFIDQTSGEAYELVVDFKQNADVEALIDSEKMTIMGKPYTFDASNDHDSDVMVMYGSDKTEVIKVLEKKTITLADGTKLEIECTDANSELSTATLIINGVLKKAVESQTITVAGQQIYVSKIYTGNIPTPTAQVEFFIGSEKVEVPTDGDWGDVTINGETVDGYEAKMVFGSTHDLTDVSELHFRFNPGELDDDSKHYLAAGESLSDPLFGTFKMAFTGATPDLKSDKKTAVSMKRTGDKYDLSFVNKDGDKYTIPELYVGNGASPALGENIPAAIAIPAASNITKNQIFILAEGDISKVFQLTNVKTDNTVAYAEVKDLTDGTKQLYANGETIGDTGKAIDILSDADNTMSLNGATLSTITTQYDGVISIGTNYTWSFTESGDNFEDSGDADRHVALTVTMDGETTDEDISIAHVVADNSSNIKVADDADNHVEYGLTVLGTYYELETDKNGAYFDLWYPEEQVVYNVFISPVAATTTTTGGNTVKTQEVNKVNAGAAAKLDTEITDAWAQNVISVGGPCVNTVSSVLMGSPAVCNTGFEQGKAYIKLFEKGDKVAMMVAGYEGPDTRRATTVLAKYDQYTAQLKGTEVVITGTTLNDITVSAPAAK